MSTPKPPPKPSEVGPVPAGPSFMDRVKAAPWWAHLVGGVIVGALIGAAAGGAETTELEDKVDKLEAQLDAARDDAKTAEAEAKAELAGQSAALDKREAKISGAEAEIAANSFGDGLWQVGVDFEPGLYRSDGSGECYWANLGSADPSDIQTNGLGPNQTAQIDGEFFESQGCGTWTKVD